MNLTAKQKRYLRTLSHKTKPVVIIGAAGLSENVLIEISATLDHHELIKVRINASDKQARELMINAICQSCNCTLVFAIGHVATFYRRSEKSKIKLPAN